jgi:methyl-accepting chemotaxis protein
MSAAGSRSVRAFRTRIRLLRSTASLPTLFGVVGYMMLLTDLPVAEWLAWWTCLAVYGVGVALALEGPYRRLVDPVARFIATEGSSPDDPRVAREAFRAIMALPLRMQRTEFVANLLPALLFPVVLTLLGHSGWLEWGRLRTYGFASFVGALFSSALIFYWAKYSVARLRSELAAAVGEPASRGELVERRSLVQKLRFAVTVPALASVLLVVNVFYDSLTSAAEEAAVDWCEVALALVAAGDPDRPLGERVRDQLPDPELWPVPLSIYEVGAIAEARDVDPGVSAALLEFVDRQQAEEARRGRILEDALGEVGSFRHLGEAGLLVAVVDRREIGLSLGRVHLAVVLVCLVMTACALLIGSLVCEDLRGALAALREEANRMASGDLRAGRIFESEDELGDLGRGFERLGVSLRETVGRVHRAADRLERMASDVSNVVAAVVRESRDQSSRLQQANRMMTSIHSQVREVSQAAKALGDSIVESTSSVRDLGATGEDLNETASVLSSKVDEVSASIEEMTRSVKGVATTTDRLVEAAVDTSSSMEEMATAMRQVDSSAETTANLSRVVVEKAELGQARVSQTIEGMDAIREATETAERVIRGLGVRTKEIGGILDVIDDVADETNLLALNAAIIASQAGEQGRAFSVVADEIKELADRVLASTKEIGGLIRAVQEESENAIGAISAGSASVMSGVDLSAEAGKTLEEITEASRESGTRIAEIVTSVREQTRASSHVVALMEHVRDSAAQIASAADDQDRGHEVVHRSALTMREVAQQVHATTEEQSRGFRRIRQSVEGIRSTVEQVDGSLREQSQACGQVAESLDRVLAGTTSNEEAAGRMGDAMQELLSQAETLREDVERFRIS